MPENYTGLVEKLHSLQSKLAGIRAGTGMVYWSGLVLLLFGILIGITSIGWLNSPARVIIDIIILSILAGVAYWWIIRPYINRLGFLPIARLLEGKYGKFQSRLIAALELHDLARQNRENYSLELIEKTIEEAGGIIGDIDANAIVDYGPLNKAFSKLGILAGAAIIGLFLGPTTIYNTWLLYSQPLVNFERPPEFAISINPSNGEFYRNMDLVVKATIDGRAPRRVDLHYKFEDGTWASEPMSKPDSVSETAFYYIFKKIKRSLDVYAKSGGIESPKAHIEIVDPPRLTDIMLKLDYPDYTGLTDGIGNPNDGNVTALKGTKVQLLAKANKPVREPYLVYADSSKVGLQCDDNSISGAFTVKENTRYTILFKDDAGRKNPEPIWYDIQTLEDYPPSITIRYPAVDIDLNERMELPLQFGISDDYGYGKLNLVYWIVSEDQQNKPTKLELKIPDMKNLDQDVSYNWNIQELNPLPGDLIYYYAEVSDNDIVSGPKWAKSKTYTARLPNLDEILADVNGAQEEQMQTLDEAIKNQEELQKQVEQMAREIQKSPEINYEKQQQAKDVLQKQQEIAQKLENLSKDMQNNLDKLDDNKLISEQLAEKMQQIQQLMEEVAPPEMKEAMKRLQEALQKMDPNEMKKALEQLQLTAEQMLENLDRALSLLQKLALEQKMDMLVQMADKLVEQQKMINESADAAGDSSSLAKQLQPQQVNENEYKQLKDQFSELQKMNQDQQMIPEKEEQDASEQVNNPEISENFQAMKENMKTGNPGSCHSKGKKLQSSLNDMANSLKMAQAAMKQKEKMEITKKMQKAAEDLLYLSDRQEALLDSTRSVKVTGDGLRQMATGQMEITSASNRVAETISDLSKESLFINITLMHMLGMTLSDMGTAIKNLDNRFAQGAIQSEQSAMSNLNKTVYLLMQAQDKAMSSGSGSGMQEMMQAMKNMSQMQAGINDQTMMQMPQPGMQMNMGQQQALQSLAAQQEMLRQQLEKLSDQYGERGEMLGRLDQLGQEMKKVVDDLQKSQVSPETIRRQEAILSRMLDAQKSANRRDYSNKRQAEQGIDVVRKSPSLPEGFTGDEEGVSEMVRKALDEGYPRQYEKLIRAYFKSLQDQETQADEKK